MTHEERRIRRLEIARAILRGEDCGVVARRFGVSMVQVYESCRENSVVVSRCGGSKTPRTHTSSFEIVGLLCNTTMTLTDVAKQVGLTRQRVSQIYVQARNANIPVKPRSIGTPARKRAMNACIE